MTTGESGSVVMTDAWWMHKLARVPKNMERSGTVVSRERVRLARARGADVLPLAGSPVYPPVPHVLEALVRSASQHVVTPARGLPELRLAIAAKLASANGMNVNPEQQVLVTNGAKEALFAVLASLVDAGEEVVFPTPAYVYAGTVELVGGVPRPVPMSEADGYRWDPERLGKAITERTKVLLVNTPANPTGFVAGLEDLRAVADLADRHNLVVLADESHERFVFDGRPHLSLAALPEARGRTVTVYSMSKAHNMMGHRLGYAVGPASIIACAAKVLEWAVLMNNFLSQMAALAVLTGPQGWINAVVARSEENRNRLSSAIDGIEGLGCVRPQGGTTHFINVSALGMTGEKVSDRLLFEYGVPTDPGRVFGEGDHIRLAAIGSRPEHIEQAIERIRQACTTFLSETQAPTSSR